MRQRAIGLREQRPLDGVVHVDVVLVREAELHDAQRIFAARRLHEAVVANVGVGPVDAVRIDLLAAAIDVETVRPDGRAATASPAEQRGEEVAATGRPEPRLQLAHLDPVRHAPRGIETDELHIGGEHRRRPGRQADDDALLEDDLAALVDARHELRNVVLDVDLAHVLGQPAPALHVEHEAQSIGLGIGRFVRVHLAVERHACRARQLARSLDAALDLKRLEREFKLFVEQRLGRPGVGRHLEALAQQCDFRRIHALL